MPIFFFVGGFSNAVAWDRRREPHASWLAARARRLALPTVPLLLLWATIGFFGPALGLETSLLRSGSQVALVPLWFLAVYVLMVAATPLTTRLWETAGARGVAGLATAALTTDVVRAATTSRFGFANDAFVWTAIYLLGHGWRSGFFASQRTGPTLALLGGSVLIAMTVLGPYHVSMVGVPGVAFGNTAPPSAALLALGITQIGVATTAARPMKRFLDGPAPWTATIAINASIMTIYVWHMTAMALAIGGLILIDAPFLAVAPGEPGWWLSRPLWIGALMVAAIPLLWVFGRFESRSRAGSPAPASPLSPLLTVVALCVVFASVSAKGLTWEHPAWAAAALVAFVVAVPGLRQIRHSRRGAPAS